MKKNKPIAINYLKNKAKYLRRKATAAGDFASWYDTTILEHTLEDCIKLLERK